ncbi:MAG: DNA-3-methyladenine glycosylase [Rhodothermales bacterium]
MIHSALPLDFYRRDTLSVARELIGKLVVRQVNGKRCICRIVETEAYLSNDPASHAFRGRTARNAAMFAAGGISYVYFIYGMHFCFNVVSGEAGYGEAVLIRAVQPLAGLVEMRQRRGNKADRQLCNGPGKLCQALAIARPQNAQPLDLPELSICADQTPALDIASDTRIGIREGAELPYRFVARNSSFISKPLKCSSAG